MFQPKYTISAKLLSHITQIAKVSAQLNAKRFPHVVTLDFEREAREISSFASTSIEGNPLPLTDVKRILKSKPAHIRDTEREVLNYNNALVDLKKHIDQQRVSLDRDFILHVHSFVMNGLMSKVSIGKFRKAPVFVNDPRVGNTVFLPPDHQDVERLMNELIAFVHAHQTMIDPLILAGIFHKQFVLIHPFIDGNGRTVRLLTKSLLAGMGLDTFHLFSFERYYNANVTKYFDAVGERGNYYDMRVDFTGWLEYFTDGILDELLRVQKELEKHYASSLSGLKEHHRKILEYLKSHASITDAEYAKLDTRARPTRALDLRYLIEQGLIVRHGKGRATYYTLSGLQRDAESSSA